MDGAYAALEHKERLSYSSRGALPYKYICNLSIERVGCGMLELCSSLPARLFLARPDWISFSLTDNGKTSS